MSTIFALATPPGKSGVAVIRISGENALDALSVFHISLKPKPRYAHYVALKHTHTLDVIDNILLLYFPAPYSFTGTDVIELHCHGSKAVIQMITELLSQHSSFRYALAGEFTRQAVEHNKLDLLQAEGIADLIDAETFQQSNQALHQLNGDMTNEYQELYSSLIEARSYCEAFLDFPDDDLPDSLNEDINHKISKCIVNLGLVLSTAERGKHIRQGVQIAIMGAPNAGKSTLINTLAERKIAITSPIAGTTRDAIELYIDIGGLPYRFFDTAGLRDTEDTIESEGIYIANEIASQSDLVLYIIDVSQDLAPQAEQMQRIVSRETICIMNKIDTIEKTDNLDQIVSRETIFISANEIVSRETILQTLSKKFSYNVTRPASATRQRHVFYLESAQDHLYASLEENDLVLKAQNLIYAANSIEYIIGKIDIEQVLDELFASFCIGK